MKKLKKLMPKLEFLLDFDLIANKPNFFIKCITNSFNYFILYFFQNFLV